MKSIFQRTLAASLAGLMMLPVTATVMIVSTPDAEARGVAVRGPRGGGVAVGGGYRGGYRAPAYRGAYGVAGGTRRVARRTARRTSRRYNTLPYGAVPYYYGGVTYYTVGGAYYEPVYQGNNVIYIEVEFDD